MKYRKALDSGRQSCGGRVVATFYDLCSQIWSGSPTTESISGGIDTAKNNAPTNSSHTTDDTSLTNSEEKQKLEYGLDGSDEDREQDDEPEGTNHKNKDEGVTANTAKAISSGKEKSSSEKMREIFDKRRNKKLTKSVPVDQQLIALHKEEMELKREMLRKIDHQEQQFNQTMKILPENMTRFTDIVSGALQMMGVAFQQQRNNVMFPPGNNYPPEWDGQEGDVEKHYTEL